jgi:hypothetical protein
MEVMQKRLPSWTGGVPSPMSEANRTRRGGGINLKKSTTPSSDLRFARSESTPPVQVFHPDRAKRASGRGVFVGESLHFNMLIFNELKRRHYKRSEGPPVILSAM